MLEKRTNQKRVTLPVVSGKLSQLIGRLFPASYRIDE
jgi:hypothetical protein